MFTQTYGRDSVNTGEGYVLFAPKNYQAPNTIPGHIHAHGAGNDSTEPLLAGGLNAFISGVAKQRRVISTDMGGVQTWGNDTAIARMTAAKTFVGSQGGKISAKMSLSGLSMGGASVLAWAAQNKSLIGCMVLMIPVLDITDIVSNNRSGSAATVNACYSGGWSEGTYGATHNPYTMAVAGAYSDLPIMIVNGSTDPISVPARVSAFAAAAGNVTVRTFAGGHDMSLGASFVPEMLDFVNTYAK